MKTLDNSAWIGQQFNNSQLGDQRRTKRLVSVAEAMLNSPDASLPRQNSRWADLKAAYRLFNNPDVTFDAVAEQHWQQTRQTKPGRYLLIGDTTDLNHTSRKATTGLGILGDGVGRGIQLHSCLMFDCQQQQIVGTAGGKLLYRKHTPENETRTQRLKRARESDVWGQVVDQVGMSPEGSQWIHVFDRGGDNFDAMCHLKLSGCDFVIRASKLQRKITTSDGRSIELQEATQEARVVGRYELNLRSRPNSPARTAKIEVSVTTVAFPRPIRSSPWVKQCGIDSVTVNVVLVQEVDAPSTVTPIRWVLLTSLPASTFDEAWQVIEDYENRWQIEEYHKVMKSGCSIEKHALRTAGRLEPLIGLLSVIGVRLFQMKLLGRSQPEVKASTHVPTSWLKCLKLARPTVRLVDMTVYTFFRELAKLGGFLGRKGDGEPGWQTIWRGYQKLQSLLDGMRLVGAI
jgi:hypothetical protein